MKTISIFIIMIALLIVGCNQDNPTDIVSTTSNDAPAQFNKNVPFMARGTINVGTPIQDPTCGDFPPWPFLWRSECTGSGNATHMGLISVETNHCFSGFNFRAFNSQGVMIGANGDKLYFTYEFYLDPPDPTVTQYTYKDGIFTITGGTGKFFGATGSGVVTGDYTAASAGGGGGMLVMVGHIIYK